MVHVKIEVAFAINEKLKKYDEECRAYILELHREKPENFYFRFHPHLQSIEIDSRDFNSKHEEFARKILIEAQNFGDVGLSEVSFKVKNIDTVSSEMAGLVFSGLNTFDIKGISDDKEKVFTLAKQIEQMAIAII